MALLHRADEAGRSGSRDVAQPRGGALRRRSPLAARRLRPRDAALHLRHRQPDSGLHRRPRRRGQPVHLRADCRQRRHRQDGVVLPDLAPRHARLGLGADADPHRRGDQGQAAQARVDRGPQRLLLHARSGDRRAPRHQQIRHGDQLGEERRQERLAAARPGEGPDSAGIARVADLGRHDQLGAACLFARYRSVLRRREERLLDLLPHRSGSARLDGPRRQGGGAGGIGRQLPHGHRSQDRQASPGGVRFPAPSAVAAAGCWPRPAS